MNCPLCSEELSSLTEGPNGHFPIVYFCPQNTNGKCNNLSGSHFINNTGIQKIIMKINKYRITNYDGFYDISVAPEQNDKIDKKYLAPYYLHLFSANGFINPDTEENLLNKIETLLLFL